ncbi:hypothetical protein MMON_02170 [Mycolicibacterium monacense]|uniref:Uncharacterized protein n=1 Tax=Mycolicibacterium monacense TaxID=85693 RepID=A0AAD1IQ87_MYCMB|nr:hypothetical protein MMON_02170 [Mycolicibacterium monacense]
MARTVPGAGRRARQAKSTAPHGQGIFGARLPIVSVGLIVIIAASDMSRAGMLGPSSTTSTVAPSLTGKRRGFCGRPARRPAYEELGTLLGAVIATTFYAVVVPGVLSYSADLRNSASHL